MKGAKRYTYTGVGTALVTERNCELDAAGVTVTLLHHGQLNPLPRRSGAGWATGRCERTGRSGRPALR